MKNRAIPLLVMLAVSVHSFSAQRLTDAEVESAIKAGQDLKPKEFVFNRMNAACIAGTGMGAMMLSGGFTGYEAIISTSVGQIAHLSADAKRLYKPFAVGDVPDNLREMAVWVRVEPIKPSDASHGMPGLVETVILRSKDKQDAVVRPVSFQTEPVEWGNLMGAKFQVNQAIASFPIDALRALPPGDLVVVVIAGREWNCKISAKDLARVLR